MIMLFNVAIIVSQLQVHIEIDDHALDEQLSLESVCGI